MKYTYENMPDKTKDGIRKEVEFGLGIIIAYFYSTKGIPVETQKSQFAKMSNEHKIFAYMNFRNQHPELFK